MTFTKFDGCSQETERNLNQLELLMDACGGSSFWEEEFLPGDDGRLIAFSLCADSERLFIGAHTQG